MDFTELGNVEFFLSLGYVTITASILTMLLMQIVKTIMKKRQVIYVGMDANEKDMVLTKIGRYIAIIVYGSLYIANEFYLKDQVVFDGALLTGLLSGGFLTLTVAKGLYTSLRQYQKKQSVFFKLRDAEEKIKVLSKVTVTHEKTEEPESEQKVGFSFNKKS